MTHRHTRFELLQQITHRCVVLLNTDSGEEYNAGVETAPCRIREMDRPETRASSVAVCR